jgi:hypothetical protein
VNERLFGGNLRGIHPESGCYSRQDLRHYVALTDKQQAELLEQTSPLSHTTKRKRR